MISREDYRPCDIPLDPGVYLFRNQLKEVIYVGKAKSLRKRLSSYFQPSKIKNADPKLRSLINSIAFVELHPVNNENESLLLESRLVKQYGPRYNTLLRDDKRFLLIRINLRDPFPKLQLARLRKSDGSTYFGPFPIAGALRPTANYLTQYFGLRTCSPREPGEEDYKHCNADVIRHCSAPCIGKVTSALYKKKVELMIEVIQGKTKEMLGDLTRRMKTYSNAQRFEQAARLRDIRQNLSDVFGSATRSFANARAAGYAGKKGVAELQKVLGLETAPRRIECFDISNIMGQFTVASMVSFLDGRPATKDYRHYRIKTVEGIDDFASMREVVMRRYMRLVEEKRSLPDLIVVDGGVGQLHAAHEVIEYLKIADRVPVVSLAKRDEEVYTTTASEPLRIERHKLSLRLLQSIRDEAHRFAIKYNRNLRRKRILDSLLDEVPGVGKKRKQQILTKFGSVRTLRKHNAAELMKRVPGVGKKLADEIMRYIKSPRAADADSRPDKGE